MERSGRAKAKGGVIFIAKCGLVMTRPLGVERCNSKSYSEGNLETVHPLRWKWLGGCGWENCVCAFMLDTMTGVEIQSKIHVIKKRKLQFGKKKKKANCCATKQQNHSSRTESVQRRRSQTEMLTNWSNFSRKNELSQNGPDQNDVSLFFFFL